MPDFHIHKQPPKYEPHNIAPKNVNVRSANTNSASAIQNTSTYTQIVSNAASQATSNQTAATQTSQNAAQISQNGFQNVQTSQLQNLANVVQNNLSQPASQNSGQMTSAQNIILTASNNITQNNLMDNESIQKYIQSMLNLPASIDKFIEQATNSKTNSNSYQFLKLFVENMIDTKLLAELLNQNSKEATQKLLNIIANSLKSGSSDVAQLKNILTVLNSIHLSTTTSSNSLRELLLLYIPLNFQIFTKTPEIKGFDEQSTGSLDDNALSIMFETYNFSNIMATVREQDNTLLLELFANENFIFDKFENVVKILAKESNIKVLIERKIIPQKETTQSNEQNFKVISNEYVSTNVLLFSHIIVRTIFKLDFDMSST